MAERRAGRVGVHTIRFRATVGAVVVVAIALVVAGILQMRVIRARLVDAAEDTASTTAINVAEQARAGVLGATLPVTDDDDQFVQVLDEQGDTVAKSDNVETTRAVVPLRPERGDGAGGDDGEDDGEDVEYDTEAGTFDDIAVDEGGRWRVVTLHVETPDGGRTVLVGSSLEDVDDALAATRQSLIFGIPVLLLLVGLVVLAVIRRSLRPVDQMRSDLEEISSRDLHRRVTVPTNDDEIHRLGGAMNDLLERLEATNEQQRRFVADASHELRSPVAGLRAQLDVALAHPDGVNWEDTARAALHDAQRVETLAADLLTLAQLEGSAQQPRTTVDLGEIAAEVLGGRARFDRGSVRMHLEPDVVVNGHPAQLARMIRNLLDNAERHAASEIDVVVRRDGRSAAIEVRDDGPGIAPEDRQVVFRRFTRLDDARAQDDGGAGLGLAIVDEIVRAHDGRVEISGPPGATFTVTLPLESGSENP